MKITLEFDSLEESRPVLNALYGMNLAPVATPVGGAAAPADAPQKRTRRTKAEMEADKAAETAPPTPAPAADPVPATPPPVAAGGDWDEDDEEDAPEPTYTKDNVREALMACQKRLSMEKAQAILKNVGGVEKLGALPEGKFAAVVNAANSAK